MNRAKLSLLILTVCSVTTSYSSADSTKEEKTPQRSGRPLEEIVSELKNEVADVVRTNSLKVNEVADVVRANSLRAMDTISKELARVHEELQEMGNKLKESAALNATQLVEETDKIRLEFQLPHDFKCDSIGNVEVVNDKVMSLSLKDEHHTITINTVLDKHRLKGQIRIETLVTDEKGKSKKSFQESVFDYRVYVGKTNLDNLAVEFDDARQVLSFVIPKEVSSDTKRSVKVSVVKNNKTTTTQCTTTTYSNNEQH